MYVCVVIHVLLCFVAFDNTFSFFFLLRLLGCDSGVLVFDFLCAAFLRCDRDMHMDF